MQMNGSKHHGVICMCDGCVSERSLEEYRKGMRNRLVENFTKFVESLPDDQLEAMYRKLP